MALVRLVGAVRVDPILHSLPANLPTSEVDGRWGGLMGSNVNPSNIPVLGAPFIEGGPKGMVGWRLERVQ